MNFLYFSAPTEVFRCVAYIELHGSENAIKTKRSHRLHGESLKFKRKLDAVMAPHTEVSKDIQNKAKKTKFTSSFTKSDD